MYIRADWGRLFSHTCSDLKNGKIDEIYIENRLGAIFPRFFGPPTMEKSPKIDEIYIKNGNFINGESRIGCT